ncbi:nitroreductase [Luteibacter rhizovicinus]|uniref:Putative NAD(P)H nitroreductase n=1 Tax=Luteibacter rhizovicinus TaxID=242606 RepID=A0A4R3YKJ4_9GAMM|nr:nitroreductase [Luteibacter rhizovicinus]TCV91273.1 nitroreductase [Luteibacter rhizovicinus]
MTADDLHLLNTRHSVPSRQLGEPAPDAASLARLLEAAVRVPDHGKLVPFRILTLRGDAKLAFGAQLTAMALAKHPDMPESKREKERHRYTFAPLVLVVVAHIHRDSTVPEFEQNLSAGCVAYNMLLGAQALGFGAQWLTGWAAYDRDVAALLGLADNEHVVGFVHMGTATMDTPDRDRPSVDGIVSEWTP